MAWTGIGRNESNQNRIINPGHYDFQNSSFDIDVDGNILLNGQVSGRVNLKTGQCYGLGGDHIGDIAAGHYGQLGFTHLDGTVEAGSGPLQTYSDPPLQNQEPVVSYNPYSGDGGRAPFEGPFSGGPYPVPDQEPIISDSSPINAMSRALPQAKGWPSGEGPMQGGPLYPVQNQEPILSHSPYSGDGGGPFYPQEPVVSYNPYSGDGGRAPFEGPFSGGPYPVPNQEPIRSDNSHTNAIRRALLQARGGPSGEGPMHGGAYPVPNQEPIVNPGHYDFQNSSFDIDVDGNILLNGQV